jgi:hypothetical protein
MARTAAQRVAEIVPDAKRQESPKEKFHRLVNKRVPKLLEQVRVLGNLSNRANYHYTDDQIAQIFGAIETAVGETKALFRPRRKKAEFRVQS